jgi:hypothetical protein
MRTQIWCCGWLWCNSKIPRQKRYSRISVVLSVFGLCPSLSTSLSPSLVQTRACWYPWASEFNNIFAWFSHFLSPVCAHVSESDSPCRVCYETFDKFVFSYISIFLLVCSVLSSSILKFTFVSVVLACSFLSSHAYIIRFGWMDCSIGHSAAEAPSARQSGTLS